MISTKPRVILVAMFKAWKKLVCPGSIPVLPAGTTTLHGAQAPALAGAGTMLETMISFSSNSHDSISLLIMDRRVVQHQY